MGELQVADVRASVALSLMDDYVDDRFSPRPMQVKRLEMLFDQVIAWGAALKPIREPVGVSARRGTA